MAYEQKQYDCDHNLTVERDACRCCFVITHGEGGEARMEISDYDIATSDDILYGFHTVQDWIKRVHEYEAVT